MKTAQKCKKCGSETMWIEESLGWKCSVDENGEIDCHNKSNEIEKVTCFDCGEIWHIENYEKINFM
jgi:hypothetical protein